MIMELEKPVMNIKKYIRSRFLILLFFVVFLSVFMSFDWWPYETSPTTFTGGIVDAYARSHPVTASPNPVFEKGSGYYAWGGPWAETMQKTRMGKRNANAKCSNPIQISEKFLCPPKDKTGGGDFVFEISSNDELKEKSIAFLQASYPLGSEKTNPVDKGIDFSDVHVAEILFAKPTGDAEVIPFANNQYSVAVRRDGTNKLVATMVFPVVAEQNGKKYLGIVSIHPLYTAYKEPNEALVSMPQQGDANDEPQYRHLNTNNEADMERWRTNVAKGEPLNPKAVFPPIAESRAQELASQYLKKTSGENTAASFQNEGYAILHVYNSAEDHYSPLNMADKPFYEFVYNGQKIWVNAFDGRVVDETELVRIAEQAEQNAKYPWFAE